MHAPLAVALASADILKKAMPDFAPLTLGRWRHAGAGAMPRHRHATGYVALVLSGGYEEVGDCGRFQSGPGDVLFHRRFEAHLDRFPSGGADTLNFDLEGSSGSFDFGHIKDADLIVRTAERDLREARDVLLATVTPRETGPRDWPDALAASIRREPGLNLTMWAEAHDLAPATVSRGFRRAYGTAPVAFRAQMRARHAWHAIEHSPMSLSVIAAENGFADQAHMTRAVGALTGATPAAWRNRKVK
jgi:AraC-like DNA-binding protein